MAYPGRIPQALVVRKTSSISRRRIQNNLRMFGGDSQQHLGRACGFAATLLPILDRVFTDAEQPGKLDLRQTSLFRTRTTSLAVFTSNLRDGFISPRSMAAASFTLCSNSLNNSFFCPFPLRVDPCRSVFIRG